LCLGAAVDVYNSLSNKQKLQSGKCHAEGDTKRPKVQSCTIAENANEAFRRINRLKKIPKIQPPNANTHNTTRGTDSRSSSNNTSSTSSSTNSSDSNDSATFEEPRSGAVESTQPTKDSVQQTRPSEQPRLPPLTPSVGDNGDCTIPFEVSNQD
jgi:hypothetical protein